MPTSLPPRTPRARWWLLLPLLGGCLARQVPPGRGLPLQAVVQVEWTVPHDVVAVGARGDTVVLRDARLLRGRVQGAWPDSFRLALTDASLASPGARDLRPARGVVTVVPDGTAAVTIVNRDPRTTEGVAFLLAVVGLTLLIAIGHAAGGG